MNKEEFLQRAQELGVCIKIKDGNIVLKGPKTAIDSLREEAILYKALLLQESNKKHPHIDKRGDLIIPSDSDPRYHYWARGQSLEATLTELKVSREIWKRYVSWIPSNSR